VALSLRQAELTGDITGMGVLRMLEALRIHTRTRWTRSPHQASGSKMFGKVRETPPWETTPFHPRSPHGVAKTFGYTMTPSDTMTPSSPRVLFRTSQKPWTG
jgi:GDPmannose 4,6-dehydratase